MILNRKVVLVLPAVQPINKISYSLLRKLLTNPLTNGTAIFMTAQQIIISGSRWKPVNRIILAPYMTAMKVNIPLSILLALF